MPIEQTIRELIHLMQDYLFEEEANKTFPVKTPTSQTAGISSLYANMTFAMEDLKRAIDDGRQEEATIEEEEVMLPTKDDEQPLIEYAPGTPVNFKRKPYIIEKCIPAEQVPTKCRLRDLGPDYNLYVLRNASEPERRAFAWKRTLDVENNVE